MAVAQESGVRGQGSGRKRGFTLVELLVVIGIMALVLVLALPRFEDIGRGGKMRAAINELRMTISLARQWAIANRQAVYLLFPDDQGTLYTSTNDYPKALRSYAVYTEDSKGTATYLKDWNYLPAGVFFVDQYNSQNLKSDSRLTDVTGKNVFRADTLMQLCFPMANSPRKTLNAFAFRPDGTCGGVNPYTILLSEAISLEGSGGKVVNLQWKANPVLWSVEVNPFTGNVKLVDFSIQ